MPYRQINPQNFEVGDKVKIIEACSGNEIDDIFMVIEIAHPTTERTELFAGECHHPEMWELVESKKKVKK